MIDATVDMPIAQFAIKVQSELDRSGEDRFDENKSFNVDDAAR